jgi:hypothetical protein
MEKDIFYSNVAVEYCTIYGFWLKKGWEAIPDAA